MLELEIKSKDSFLEKKVSESESMKIEILEGIERNKILSNQILQLKDENK